MAISAARWKTIVLPRRQAADQRRVADVAAHDIDAGTRMSRGRSSIQPSVSNEL